MNIFVLDENPEIAARMHCDKHVPKMCVEAAQMMASALRRHGATDEQMPLTKAGRPYLGGYKNHPCTRWAGDSMGNYQWLAAHATELYIQYKCRFGKTHACEEPINKMCMMDVRIKPHHGRLTPFAQAMPDEYKDEDAVKAYRAYYHSKQFAKWEKGTPAPDWWQGVEVTV
tara:strand:+ start:2951 stop:3463 length:513 start_codon:yes stop_codon:yes gene_type:complete